LRIHRSIHLVGKRKDEGCFKIWRRAGSQLHRPRSRIV
jgi:hypothetical protein